MRKLLLVLVCLFRVNTFYCQWTNVDFTSKLDWLNDIHFTSNNTGFISGNVSGFPFGPTRIYKTTNGGTNWTKVYELTSGFTLYHFAFTSPTNGFCTLGGSNGYINYVCRTINAGVSWDTVRIPGTYGAQHISFPSSNVGYIAGAGSSQGIYKTTDAGLTWTDITPQTPPTSLEFFANCMINDIYFTDNATGFICTGGNATNSFEPSRVYKTTDGGLTWNSVFSIPNTTGAFKRLCFVDANVGFVSGTTGIVYKTTDGGNTWTSISISTQIDVYGIYFFNSQLGYACSSSGITGIIYKTTNGGLTWTTDNSGQFIVDNYYSISFSQGSGYACGRSGYSKLNNAPIGVEEISRENLYSVFPNPIKDKLIIKTENPGSYNFTLKNVYGQIVKEMEIATTNIQIQLSDLKSGVYFYELKNSSTVLKTGKLIKE